MSHVSCDGLDMAPGFVCTGSNESKSWDAIHKIPHKMGCGHCAGEAKKDFIGLHDVSNIALGKGAYDPNNFEAFVKKINTVHRFWISKGKPKRVDSPN